MSTESPRSNQFGYLIGVRVRVRVRVRVSEEASTK